MSAIGCSSTTTNDHSLDLARVDVQETPTELIITGYDSKANEIGSVDLKVGAFYMEDHEAMMDGRRMHVELLGKTTDHESAGFNVLRLPLFDPVEMEDMNAFLTDRRVASRLAGWGITFEAVPERAPDTAPLEPGYTAYACGPAGLGPTPCNGAGSPSCLAVDDLVEVSFNNCLTGVKQAGCCTATKRAFIRRCGYGSDNPCGAEGPNGCTVCWNPPYETSCSAVDYGATTNTCYDEWYQDTNYIAVTYN